MNTYEYKFVRIPLNFWTRKPKEDYQAIVQQHAAKGWRLVQILAPGTGHHGKSEFYELIFEQSRNLNG
ncbi:MAG TPA: DUF4177 domain-containing protein [Bacteroidales bacterium]|nr:MAG: hypothetical protein A2X11_13150 [Bacteroidetes bacterium GWE2_42_24]OFY25364.1 MAG: hypothetical protein A2X09_10355 [Bacteroidetes bacterium GWF2_43_11]PKP26644.1 MAG: DUF4177 domain-containing protein [Bacteroidetes bacterium HGW-Bacteroidetes-22]HAQ64315.1 DUF4177 domain-containing protein [Bacteroidales bacterium]HBZ67635.1 DUF4177 domain-containing protein [Bacteroidales bacterium]